MHLIVCLDDRDGMSFCGRRLSQDRKLCDHILQFTVGHTLWISPYSKKLFPQALADEHFQQKAGHGDYCFLETDPLLDVYEDLESVILYRWNRTYPATAMFSRDLLKTMELVYSEEFSGSSHEKITMEKYTQ